MDNVLASVTDSGVLSMVARSGMGIDFLAGVKKSGPPRSRFLHSVCLRHKRIPHEFDSFGSVAFA
jgi:hypothetical protein